MAGAVGGGDQHGGDLRVHAHEVFQAFEVQAIRPEAGLYGSFHIDPQRRAIRRFATTLQEHGQRHAGRQRRNFAVHVFAFIKQQILQALGQAFHVRGLVRYAVGAWRQASRTLALSL